MKSLALDHWYKVVIWIGVAAMGLSLTIPLQVPNLAVLLMGAGAFIFGIGQWINHPLQTRMAGVYKLSSHNRLTSAGGIVAEVVGLAILSAGIYVLLKRAAF